MTKFLWSIVGLILFFSQIGDSAAQAARSYNGKINTTVANVVHQKSVQRGFAANDPRFSATMDAISVASNNAVFGTATTGLAVGAGLALAAGAPVWLTVAAAVGSAALLLGVAWAVGKYLLGASGSGMSETLTAAPVGPVTPGIPTYSGQTDNINYLQSQPLYNAVAPPHLANCPTGFQYRMNYTGSAGPDISNNFINNPTCLPDLDGVASWINADVAVITGMEVSPGITMADIKCGYAFYTSGRKLHCTVTHPNFALVGNGMSDIVANSIAFDVYQNQNATKSAITASEVALATDTGVYDGGQVDPQMMASIVVEAWRAAVLLPGYTGLPYDEANPVTVADVRTYYANNPSIVPQIDSIWSSPAPATDPRNIPFPSSPYVNPTLGPITPPATGQPPAPAPTGMQCGFGAFPPCKIADQCGGPGQALCKIDFGPSSPAPDAPTTHASSDITTLLAIPSLSALQSGIVLPSAACPTFTIPFFATSGTVTAHCQMAEDNRATFSAVFLVVWMLTALIIILSA
jgi:hypothetical protein